MGVACVKIEGRMKRPEYVAVVTGIYARAIREGREPTAEELEQLRSAFSRDGFTDGYFLGQTGPEMFGTRQDEAEPRELFTQARATYESRGEPEGAGADVRHAPPGEPAQVAVQDAQEHLASVTGPVPEGGGERPPDP